MRRFLAFLRGLFPFLKPRGTWSDAVRVTDMAPLVRLERCYVQTVSWCRVQGFTIQAPDCLLTLRYWPDALRAPSDFGIGKVLAPNVIPGDTHGTMVLREQGLDEDWLMIHEAKHAITGVSGHPRDLFPNG